MKFRRQSNEEVSVNLTPLIDVVFLLLIFFMVTTTMTKQSHLSIDLPTANGAPSTKSTPEQLEIIISKTGEYSVSNATEEKALINKQLKTLKSALAKMSNGNTDLPVIITADANAPHQAVVSAMEAAGSQGFEHLSITTRKNTSE